MGGCPRCLPFDAPIDTPSGPRAVSDLVVGDAIWSQDETGARVTTVVARTQSIRIVSPHSFTTLVLADGRTLVASGRHPLADGTMIAAAEVGKVVDGSTIVEIRVEATDADSTFDVRPATASGTYWVSGVLVGSTIPR